MLCSLQSKESVWSKRPITTVGCMLNVGCHAGSRFQLDYEDAGDLREPD